MRKPVQILIKTKNIFDAIDEAQTEAWNEAIEAVHKHPKVKYLPTMNGMKVQIFAEDLLKLKK